MHTQHLNSGPVTWGADELANFLGLERKTILDRCSRAPDRLPPRLRKTGPRDKPRWLVSDVVAWAKGDPLPLTSAPGVTRVEGAAGRPRKKVRSVG